MKSTWKIILFIAALMIAGCGGPLAVNYLPPTPVKPVVMDGPHSIRVLPFEDSREGLEDPLKVGFIETTVSNMGSGPLVLTENPADILTGAFAEELSLAGFKVSKETGGEPEAEYTLTGELREFTVNIESRDYIRVSMATTLKESATGRVVWSGEKGYEHDRYAGVTGNSRGTISNYISASLSKVIRESINEFAGEIRKSSAAVPAISPMASDPVAVEAGPLPEGMGRLVISTETPKARVYIDEVYYGLTPTSIDLTPGIYTMTLRHPDGRAETEKVAVTVGRITVYETVFEAR